MAVVARNRVPEAVYNRLIPTTQQARKTLLSVGIHPPLQIRVGDILDLLDSPEHTYSDDNFFTLFRCGKAACVLCPGTCRDVSPVVCSALGPSPQRGLTAALLVQPLVDENRPGHYLRVQDKIERAANGPAIVDLRAHLLTSRQPSPASRLKKSAN